MYYADLKNLGRVEHKYSIRTRIWTMVSQHHRVWWKFAWLISLSASCLFLISLSCWHIVVWIPVSVAVNNSTWIDIFLSASDLNSYWLVNNFIVIYISSHESSHTYRVYWKYWSWESNRGLNSDLCFSNREYTRVQGCKAGTTCPLNLLYLWLPFSRGAASTDINIISHMKFAKN